MSKSEATWLDVLAYPVRLDIVRALHELDDASATELCDRSHASAPTLRRHLEALVEIGVVRARSGSSDGLTPGRPAAHFLLDPAVREPTAAMLAFIAAPIRPSPRRPPWPVQGR